MRVGVIGPRHPDSLADNILDALPALGAEPVELGEVYQPRGPSLVRRVAGQAVGLSAGWERRSQRASAQRIAAAGCDVVVNVQQQLHASTARVITAGGARLALWFPDHVANIGRLTMFETPYDAIFLKDRLFAERMASTYGLPCHYLPEACNPRWHRPVGDYGTQRHVVVVGNVYPTRGRLLRRLVADGVPLRIFGGPLPKSGELDDLTPLHAGRAVFGQDKSVVFRGAAAVLNNLHPAEMASVNCRLFEATAAGGVVLCEHRPALGELFDVGREVLAFSSYDELLEQCRAVLGAPGWVTSMADRAARRAAAEHTYQHRLARILELLA